MVFGQDANFGDEAILTRYNADLANDLGNLAQRSLSMIGKQLGGVLFVDFGQVSLHAWDPPINDLRFAAGFGFRYATPVGPVRLDFGFPFQPRDRDRSWQIFFDIGQSF